MIKYAIRSDIRIIINFIKWGLIEEIVRVLPERAVGFCFNHTNLLRNFLLKKLRKILNGRFCQIPVGLIIDSLKGLQLRTFSEPLLDILVTRNIKAFIELNIAKLGVKLDISKTKMNSSRISCTLNLKLLV